MEELAMITLIHSYPLLLMCQEADTRHTPDRTYQARYLQTRVTPETEQIKQEMELHKALLMQTILVS